MKHCVVVFIGIFFVCGGAQAQWGIPPNDYNIMIFYELGMHCTGFDISYCCVLPPYNSVLAQIVKTSKDPKEKPQLLRPEHLQEQGWVLWYEHDQNTFSEGPKMLYWNVPYDVNGNGTTTDPIDSFANHEFSQLFTYAEAPLKFKPEGATKRLFVGPDIQIPLDHGPTGKPISFDVLDFTGEQGTIVYTFLNDGKTEIAIPLGQRYLWEALGLPLTALFDGATPHIRAVREEMLRPYQIARVSLKQWQDRDGNGKARLAELTPVRHANGLPVSFIGTNPIDTPACTRCHSSYVANGDEFQLYKKEYDYWKDTFSNTSDYYASVKAASISMLEIHDKRIGTDFLSNYNPDDTTGASATRLGRPPVKCQECHADNVLGVLRGVTDPLTVSIHVSHLRTTPEPDKFGRPANCQVCHPAHWQNGSLEHYPVDDFGRFKGVRTGDVRQFWGGCFIGRDVHSNPRHRQMVSTRSHLNAVGTWMLQNVMNDGQGLYCTNCHNVGSRLLYKADALKNFDQAGETLRNQPMDTITEAFQSMDGGRYADWGTADFWDPKVSPVDRVRAVWEDPPVEPYGRVSDAGDFWLAAGEPKCADCHKPPFVESLGGSYFPIDQEKKYSLMRYSKGHSGLACQSCHQSTHGLHPVNPLGPDPTTHQQAASLNPDGSAGPVKCAACHTVDADGVPGLVQEAMLVLFPDDEYPTRYEKAVALSHVLRKEY